MYVTDADAARLGSCVAVLWWCRLATVAAIQPLAWELPYAASAALKKKVYFMDKTNIPFDDHSPLHGNSLNLIQVPFSELSHIKRLAETKSNCLPLLALIHLILLESLTMAFFFWGGGSF